MISAQRETSPSFHATDEHNDIHAIVNSKLYNHTSHREQLSQEYDYQSHSDCEAVLVLYMHYGPSFLSHLRGEFALVLWDVRRQVLVAARDRYEIKSLYYTVVGGRLLVGTEMKCSLPFGWRPEWDARGLREHSWKFSSRTFFEGMHSVRGLDLLARTWLIC